MKALALICIPALLIACTSGDPNPEAEFTSLFDGKTSAGWRGFKQEGFPTQGWVIEDGALHHQAQGGGGDIMTVEKYTDFDFRFDWKVAPGANSGVIYRVSEAHDATWQTGPEYQILDDATHTDGKNTSTSAASLYALYVPEGKTVKPVGEWNAGRILLQNNRLQHWVNGVKVVDCTLGSEDWDERVAASKFASMPGFGKETSGHIAFQDHGDAVWYRNIRVRRLD